MRYGLHSFGTQGHSVPNEFSFSFTCFVENFSIEYSCRKTVICLLLVLKVLHAKDNEDIRMSLVLKARCPKEGKKCVTNRLSTNVRGCETTGAMQCITSS